MTLDPERLIWRPGARLISIPVAQKYLYGNGFPADAALGDIVWNSEGVFFYVGKSRVSRQPIWIKAISHKLNAANSNATPRNW